MSAFKGQTHFQNTVGHFAVLPRQGWGMRWGCKFV